VCKWIQTGFVSIVVLGVILLSGCDVLLNAEDDKDQVSQQNSDDVAEETPAIDAFIFRVKSDNAGAI